MIKNKLRTIWSEGRPSINGWLSIGSAFTAEIMAAQGYDSVTVDLQHGALDYSAFLPMLQAVRASGVVPMARVPWLEPGIIMKALDAGAYGIICPMINTAEAAADFVSYVRYPPLGQRSFGPTRANFSAGIDGIYVGPADLTFSLHEGRLAPAFDREEREMIEALRTIVAACKNAGKRAALHCGTPDYAARAIEWGFEMTTVAGDSRLLAAAAQASVARFRELTGAVAGMASSSAGKGGY